MTDVGMVWRHPNDRKRWWRSKRSTKVREINPGVSLDGGTYQALLLDCTYHWTTVVACDYDKKLIKLCMGGHDSKTTRDRMNECASTYSLPFDIWTHKGHTFVRMWGAVAAESHGLFNSGKVMPFEEGMTIPFHPKTIHIPGAWEAQRMRYEADGETALRVKFIKAPHGDLLLIPWAGRWHRRIKSYLAKFDQEWLGEVNCGPFEKKESINTIKLWLSMSEEGMLRSGETVTKAIPVEEFLRRYVGFDSEMWLT